MKWEWGERTVLRAALYLALAVNGAAVFLVSVESPVWTGVAVSAAVALAGLAASARPPD